MPYAVTSQPEKNKLPKDFFEQPVSAVTSYCNFLVQRAKEIASQFGRSR